MKRIMADKANNEKHKQIIAALGQKKVLVLPTDTVYGLSCLATSKEAIKKINQIKKRSSLKPQIILVSSLTMARRYCFINKRQAFYLKKKWPGKMTAILDSKNKLPKIVSGGGDTLAIRLPKNDFLIKIIKKVGAPITSSSLNISGHPLVNDLSLVSKIFIGKHKPDLIVDAGEMKNIKPSKIIDIRDINKIKIIRR